MVFLFSFGVVGIFFLRGGGKCLGRSMEESGRSSGGVEIVGCGGNVRNRRKCAWRATKCCKGIVGGIWKEYCGESVGKIEEVVCPRRGEGFFTKWRSSFGG